MAPIARLSGVEDYGRWQAVYWGSASEAARQASGWRDQQVFRNPEDPNEIVIISEVDDLERTRAYAVSEEVRKRRRASGLLEVSYHLPRSVSGAPGRPQGG